MAVLGSLKGAGTLMMPGKLLGDVSYDLIVTAEPDRGVKRGDGRLTFKSRRQAMGIIMEARATLELECGATVGIVLTRTTVGDHADAAFVTSGPIPGF